MCQLKNSLIYCCLFFFTSSAFALPSDKNQPIHIVADKAHLEKTTGVGIFEGNVKLTQGTSTLVTPQLTIYCNQNNELLKAIATGEGTTYRTLTDPKKPPFIATAQTIQYFAPQRQIILTGDAKAVQGPNTYHAPEIQYQIDQEMVISPDSKQGRTTIVIDPKTFQHDKE